MENEIEEILNELTSFTKLAVHEEESTAERTCSIASEKLESYESKCSAITSEIELDSKSYESLIKKEINLYNSFKQIESELKEATIELQNLNELIQEQRNREISLYSPNKNIQKKLETTFSITGFTISEYEFCEPTKCKAKMKYNENENYHLTFLLNVETNSYTLLDMCPRHKNFDAIKDLLDETNDITGLIANAREYFKRHL